MAYFGQFYLDKEKDMIITLHMYGEKLTYKLRTPNHKTGNLITNLATLCKLPITYDKDGLKIIEGDVPCYVDGENRMLYILRMGKTKVANIYPDGSIERKAYIPAIAKTLMSQTKDYKLDEKKTLVKTYIRNEVKFHTDLHTHRSANLSPDLLIALAIHHQLRYPYYYVKKLKLRLTETQRAHMEEIRAEKAIEFKDCGLKGKYLDRRIDDNIAINFADMILGSPENSVYNIPRIRASLAVMKDGQAVFTNLEKVYLYRYVFTKGKAAEDRIELKGKELIPDRDIVEALRQMDLDRQNPDYADNTLYQDELLWIARSYRNAGIMYAEISDTALVKPSEAARTLQEIHGVMPAVTRETGVTLRFLAALRRIPLTIVKDQVDHGNYFLENLQVLAAVAEDPYVAGSDFVGEEMNDIRELKPVIAAIVKIARNIPSYVVRIHAGENDSLPDNVLNSILCVEETLEKGQNFPHMRIGHGLYTAKFSSPKGKLLIEKLNQYNPVLEFQISSNVRLNNLSRMDKHPLKDYLDAGVLCVQGTDGGALYGSDSLDEQLALERMLNLRFSDMEKMRYAEERVLAVSLPGFEQKMQLFTQKRGTESVEDYLNRRIREEKAKGIELEDGERRYESEIELKDLISDLPQDRTPIVIAGGSFNLAGRRTELHSEEIGKLNQLLAEADPAKYYFVIGPTLTGYEKYIFDHAKDSFDVYAFVPTAITKEECRKLRKSGIKIRVSIESSPLGIYKSIAFEIFKRRESILIALDGNSAAANLMQDAKNSKYKNQIFVNQHSRGIMAKARSLQGYVQPLNEL